jgi:phospholipase/carboxylesterase
VRIPPLCAALLALASCGDGRPLVTPPTGSPRAWTERTAEPERREAGRRAPLLVLLHGIGADENDLFPLARTLDPRFAVVSLRAPYDYASGFAWFHIEFHPGGDVHPDAAQARRTLEDLVRWLDAAPARLGTDAARTFLLGFSQGAMMSLGVLRTAPALVAGVVALSGRTPEALFPERADRDAIARVPLLVAHGTLDDVLPVEHGRRTRQAFETLSRDFTYREYPVGHAIAPDELALVGTWLTTRLDAAP